MKYRSRYDIFATILRLTLHEGSITKTRLMYGSWLSFTQVNEFLATLQTNQLVAKDEETRTFFVTDKGLNYLNFYEGMVKTLA